MTHILLTNDDGIEAPGLWALVQALESTARLTIFAPDHNWSAAGHTKTMHKPLRVRPVGTRVRPVGTRVSPYSFSHRMSTSAPDEAWGDRIRAYTTTGAPSDCVALALLGILPQRPDLVVSGINEGANFGHDLTYSGTVAAAMEAVIFGLPAIAVSLDMADDIQPADEDYPAEGGAPGREYPVYGCPPGFDFAAKVAAWVVRQVEEQGLPAGTFLNVNVPGRSPGEAGGDAGMTGPAGTPVVITRLGRRVYRDVLIERQDPRGRPYYWIGGEPPSGHLDEGTDIWAVANGYVSITPVHLDMTAHDLIPVLQGWQFE